ncbi:MAG: FkbM family methyltransferase [Tannerella sp.]|jgi:FkbM family methyltransferase|nr:FkbM family methyltransferase [Tannerella sp.]
MIINNDYIISRMIALKKEQLDETSVKRKRKSLFRQITRIIPGRFKKRLKTIVCSQYNPLYVYYTGRKQLKNSSKNNTVLFHNHVWAINFIEYCMENTVYFDTHNFFSEEDDVLIQQHIDYRIKCFLGCRAETMNEEQLNCLRLMQNMEHSVKTRKDFYVLPSDNRKYYLPQNQFEINTWGYHYGLKLLPDKVKESIRGKDFLDIGAFIGDSALMFLQYCPKRIFAYEPVTATYKDLIKTVECEGNAGIYPVKKGMGDKKMTVKIAVKGMASSILDGYDVNRVLPAESIEITTIDAECTDKNVGLIKMDIEGFEYFAIKGGLETIKKDKPVLLISIYHTGKDFFEIPPMIKLCVPEYTFKYLDIMPSNPIDEKILVGYTCLLS